MQADLKITALAAGYDQSPVLSDISMRAQPGKLTVIVGPNGSGKTSLLHSVLNRLKVMTGTIRLGDQDLLAMSCRNRAQMVALVPQTSASSMPVTVAEMVLLGRSPHMQRLGGETMHDLQIAHKAMSRVSVDQLYDRNWLELSGGERQRVMIARALAQQPQLLLLDEPTAHLDVGHQHSVMSLAAELARDDNLAVVCVLHDLNLAAAYGDELIVIKDGRIVCCGPPAIVITADMMQSVYGVQSLIRPDPVSGRPHVFTTSLLRTGVSEKKAFVIGGGGSASSILDMLYWRGIKVTLGVVNIGDHDWVRARELGFSTIDAPPFSVIKPESFDQLVTEMAKADMIIVAAVPFGPGNVENLHALAQLATEQDKQIALVEMDDAEQRDWTGGKIEQIYSELKRGGANSVASDDLGSWVDQI